MAKMSLSLSLKAISHSTVEMLRIPSLPPLQSPKHCMQTLRLLSSHHSPPTPPSLTRRLFSPPPPPPQQQPHSPSTTSFMIGSPRPSVKRASFSTGNGEAEKREILVQHLLIREDDARLLLELQQRIAGGEDLSDLATEFSICPSKEKGGMLGWVQRGQMVPEFEEAAFSAPLNKVVRCKTKFGWHLLQVLSKREESILQDIDPKELHLKMQDPNFIEDAQLIDVREPDEVARASLPGFKVLPLRQFGSWGSEVTTEFDPEKDTYVLCHHGMRSLQVAKWLQTQGFKRVFNIAGGIHAYAIRVDASIPTY